MFPEYSTGELLAITEKFARESEYVPARGADERCGASTTARCAARASATRGKRGRSSSSPETQALRLAGTTGAELADLEPEELVTLQSEDVVGARPGPSEDTAEARVCAVLASPTRL